MVIAKAELMTYYEENKIHPLPMIPDDVIIDLMMIDATLAREKFNKLSNHFDMIAKSGNFPVVMVMDEPDQMVVTWFFKELTKKGYRNRYIADKVYYIM